MPLINSARAPINYIFRIFIRILGYFTDGVYKEGGVFKKVINNMNRVYGHRQIYTEKTLTKMFKNV